MTELFSHPDTVPDEAPDEGLPVPVMQAPADAPPPPAVLFAGTHVVYDDGQGGVVLVIQDREGNSIQKHLPAAMLRLAEKFTGVAGGGMGALGSLFGKG